MNKARFGWLVLGATVGMTVLACAPGDESPQGDSDLQIGSTSSALGSTLTGAMVASHTMDVSLHALPGGSVLAFGDRTTAVAELYDPPSRTWSATGTMITSRDGHASATLADGRVLAVGGMTNNNVRLTAAEIYNPTTKLWQAAGNISSARIRLTATTLSDGRVLVAGGLDNTSNPVATVDIYNPSTGTWTTTAPLPKAVSLHTATRLTDGRVLITGGVDASTYSATAAIFNPATNSWSATGSMSIGRAYHRAQLLQDGRVLVVGGTAATAEIYDPATGTFSSAGSMSVNHAYPWSGMLANGDVLVGGGTASAGDSTTLERYRPGVGWSIAGTTAIPRQHTNTSLLADGKLLVAGGWSSTGQAPKSAETLDDTVASCVPTTCAAQGKNCGSISDGCGGTLTCGTCGTGQSCSATNVCVAAPPSSCSHGTCTAGAALVRTCNSCAQTVCQSDSYCCTYAWDSICVSESRSWCGGCF